MNKTELQAEVTRLTEMSTKLAEMLNDKIDECTILSSEVASLRGTVKEIWTSHFDNGASLHRLWT